MTGLLLPQKGGGKKRRKKGAVRSEDLSVDDGEKKQSQTMREHRATETGTQRAKKEELWFS